MGAVGSTHTREQNKTAQYAYRRIRNGTINDRMYSAKTRAKAKVIEYDLTLVSLIDIWEKQEGKCALSGVTLGYVGTGWSAASLDRIEPTKGYTIDNVQWTARRVNDAKSNMTNNDFVNMCGAIAATTFKQKETNELITNY